MNIGGMCRPGEAVKAPDRKFRGHYAVERRCPASVGLVDVVKALAGRNARGFLVSHEEVPKSHQMGNHENGPGQRPVESSIVSEVLRDPQGPVQLEC